MISGHCSACGAEAEQAPSGNWWHKHGPCPNRSQTVWPVAIHEAMPDGTILMRALRDDEGAASFVADDAPQEVPC